MRNFNFNSAQNTTIFTNNVKFVEKMVADAFKSEGRSMPTNACIIAGDCGNGMTAMVIDFGGFIRVSRKVKFRAKNNTHSIVIFPEFTRVSNPDWVKANFNNTKGNWSWNE